MSSCTQTALHGDAHWVPWLADGLTRFALDALYALGSYRDI